MRKKSIFTGFGTVIFTFLFVALAFANPGAKERKVEWFLDDIDQLKSVVDYNAHVAAVWPGDKIPEGGYVLPGSRLELHYRSQFNMYLTMLLVSPDAQVTPLFVNRYNHMIPTKNPISKYNITVPPVEGPGAAILLSSRNKLERETIENAVRNMDSGKFPNEISSMSFCHFIVKDYVNTMVPSQPEQQPQQQGQGGMAYQHPTYGGGYNQPYYMSGGGPQQSIGPNVQHGQYGPQPIPLSQMGNTYYFYPNGWVSRDWYPTPYYYPYYYYRPMYYGFPNKMHYVPQGQKYYIIPSGNGVKTNLYDFIFEANFDHGSIILGDGGFIGGKFYVDGNNPSQKGLTFRFPSKTYVSHEGPDGNWSYYMPGDFDFYLNGQPLPIYGGGQNSPFISIPMQGFLMNGLNEFKLLPRPNQNFYGIGPIDISFDIKF